MQERRRTPRLKKENEFTINIVTGEENLSTEEIPYNSKDISVYGAKIQGNILLPVDTIIKIEITLNNLQQKIISLGKVKWNKFIMENESYEAGVEFVDTPDEAIQKEDAFISKEKWSKLQELNKYEIPPEDDAFISEEKWSNLQEFDKYEIPPEGDIFIPVEEWSKLQELNIYEMPPEGDIFIPVEEWSKLQEINEKKEVSITKQIKKTIETVATDVKNCPYCNQEIKIDAVECIHCGEWLNKEITRGVFI